MVFLASVRSRAPVFSDSVPPIPYPTPIFFVYLCLLTSRKQSILGRVLLEGNTKVCPDDILNSIVFSTCGELMCMVSSFCVVQSSAPSCVSSENEL